MEFLENYLEKELIIAEDEISKEEFCGCLQTNTSYALTENNKLRQGEYILIKNKIPTIYIVKPEDNLESISRKFNKPISEILRKNNARAIFIGQQLFI